MNILLLTRLFAIGVGGGPYLFVLLAELLAERGHNVWVITNKLKNVNVPNHKNLKTIFISPSRHYQPTQQANIKDLICDSFSAIKVGCLLICDSFSAIKVGYSLIKKEKISIIHSEPILPTVIGFILSQLTSRPHIRTIHHMTYTNKEYVKESIKQGNSKWTVFRRSIFFKIINKMNCSATYTVSENTKNDIINLGIKKPIYAIPPGIPIKKEENIGTENFQFIHISRLEFYKNLEVVIKAIKILKKSFPKVTLVIVGDGHHKEKLEKFVSELDLQENVIFKGRVSEEVKKNLLSSSRALVFPSLYEGFGFVILEAFAHKKPVLVSRVRPLSDIVEHNKTGLTINPHDENEWAEAMKHILNDQDNALKMGEVGRRVLEEKYNLEIMGDRILEMYNHFIKK